MPSNIFIQSGDHVKLLTSHTWSAHNNPTNARGVVHRTGTNLQVTWLIPGETPASNTYRDGDSDLLLLPVTIDPTDTDMIQRYQNYCSDLDIELDVVVFGESKITLTPLHPEQQV
ncbi:MAG: hypothetical protein ACRC6V_15680 [Bacteroidales bacterium]